jgi:hypothetical protein
MRLTRRSLWLARCAPLAGLLLANGCMANLERNLDLVFSPTAVDNATVLPYASVAGLAEVVIRLFLR